MDRHAGHAGNRHELTKAGAIADFSGGGGTPFSVPTGLNRRWPGLYQRLADRIHSSRQEGTGAGNRFSLGDAAGGAFSVVGDVEGTVRKDVAQGTEFLGGTKPFFFSSLLRRQLSSQTVFQGGPCPKALGVQFRCSRTIATEFDKKSQSAIRLYLNCPEGLNKR